MLTETEADQVIEELIRAGHVFVAVAANSLVDEGEELSLQQYRALALLASEENQRPADLARSLGVTPSTTTSLCDRLAQKRLIYRLRRDKDRRSVYLVVSAKGHEALDRVASRRGALLWGIFTRLSSETQAQLAAALPAFIAAADDVNVAEWSIRGL